MDAKSQISTIPCQDYGLLGAELGAPAYDSKNIGK